MSEILDLTLQTLSQKQGDRILTIEMKQANPFTDYFVITTAKNLRHANALAEDLLKEVSAKGYPVRTREGAEGSSWILVDLYDVIVHIFTEEAREQYKLESLWEDLPMEEYKEDTS